MAADPLTHYSREDVSREIADYARSRWVAVEAGARGGRRMFFRYRGDEPLAIGSPDDVPAVIRRFAFARPRAVYATANLYSRLTSRFDVDKPENVSATTAVWDIDNELEGWKQTLEAARLIVEELERAGVTKSVYLKWSGRGCHVHLHEEAFSPELRSEHHPLDLAYAVVEYVIRRIEDRVAELARDSPQGGQRALAVENDMDMKRVFTVPLSLHRELDVVAVCFKPDEIDDFDLDWLRPDGFRHNPDWREHEAGEADELARRALGEVGGYFTAKASGEVRTRVGTPLTRAPAKKPRAPSTGPRARKIGRFQVMGLLQAARYYLLRGDLEKAKSFGLNRAIFYAWAKRTGGRVRRPRPTAPRQKTLLEAEEAERPRFESVGDEVAYLSDDGYFEIGDQVQRPEDYDRQIASKIGQAVPYEEAWRAALNYLSTFPREVLLSQREFFEKAYKPVRDRFHEVLERYSSKRPRGLDEA